MPTPESTDAFAKLVAARARLNEISRDLTQALNNAGTISAPHRELQERWDEALKAFQKATDEFSAIVHRIRPANTELGR